MATPNDVGRSVAKTMDAASRQLRAATKAALKRAEPVVQSSMRATGSGPTGGDMRLSRFKGGNVRMTQKFVRRPGALTVAPRGPWGIIESGARPHGGHPGTRSKQGVKAWTRGRDQTLVVIGRTVDDIADEVGEAFQRG